MTDNNQTGLAKIQDRARNRVREVFAEVFTDEELDQMLKAEIDAFFNKPTDKMKLVSINRREYQGHGQPERYVTEATEVNLSPFQLIVWQFCSMQVLEMLTKNLDQPEFKAQDNLMTLSNNDGSYTNFMVTELGAELQKRAESMAKDNMHLMFAQMFAGMFKQGREEMLMEFQSRFNGM